MPLERRAGGDVVEDLLLALILLPAGEDLMRDLDVGILGERPLEALVAIAVGRCAGGAAHVDDVALAADLLEQPLRAEIGVFFLVVRDDVGRRLGDRLVDRDDDDAGVRRFLERRIDARRVGRVDDDGVDAGGDQIADVLELAGGVGVAVRDVQRLHLAGGERLRLHRADHLLAPAVALHRVGDADRVVLRRRRTGQRRHGDARKHRQISYLSHGELPFLHIELKTYSISFIGLAEKPSRLRHLT